MVVVAVERLVAATVPEPHVVVVNDQPEQRRVTLSDPGSPRPLTHHITSAGWSAWWPVRLYHLSGLG